MCEEINSILFTNASHFIYNFSVCTGFDGNGSNSGGSVDGLNFDEIDEIDTSQMQIYDGAPIKNRRPEVYSKGKGQQMKTEPAEVPQTSNSGKSLLKNVKEIEEDLMKTTSEVTDEANMASTSSVADPMVYDASQVNYFEASHGKIVNFDFFPRFPARFSMTNFLLSTKKPTISKPTPT